MHNSGYYTSTFTQRLLGVRGNWGKERFLSHYNGWWYMTHNWNKTKPLSMRNLEKLHISTDVLTGLFESLTATITNSVIINAFKKPHFKHINTSTLNLINKRCWNYLVPTKLLWNNSDCLRQRGFFPKSLYSSSARLCDIINGSQVMPNRSLLPYEDKNHRWCKQQVEVDLGWNSISILKAFKYLLGISCFRECTFIPPVLWHCHICVTAFLQLVQEKACPLSCN